MTTTFLETIDFRVRLRTPHMLKPWDPDNPAPHFKQYIDFYKMRPRLSPLSMDMFVQNMHEGGVAKGVVCGGSIEDNNHMIEIQNSTAGKHFYYIAGVQPQYGIARNLAEIERVAGQGFLGINVSPYIWGVKANASILYPLYAFCEMHQLIVIIHGSLHYNRFQSMWLGDPKYMDEIAMHFPRLKIIISHAGNGFGVLGLAVAQKHPNIYLEFSALWPKYLPQNTITAVNTYLKDRCLFGTDYPLVDFKEGVTAWSDALRPEVKPLFFKENATRCLTAPPVE